MATQNTNPTDNIFSGLKVVDFSSFVAGPGAAVILSDFGADVIKVEPPKGELWRIGNKIPPQPQSKYPYMWHLNNRNKRGVAIDLKSPDAAKIVERLAKWADVFIVNTPHPAREKLKLDYDHVAQFNPRLIYADITGYGDTGPDAALPGFDLTAYWSRTGLLSLLRDAGAPPTWPFAGTGDAPSGVGLFAAIVTALYRRERTGKGSSVTTSLLAAGVWSAGVAIQAALAGAKFAPQHDRKNPANAAMNVYKSSDNIWFVIETLVNVHRGVCGIFSVVLRCELCPGKRRLNRDAGGPNACGQKRSGNGRTFASPFAPIKRCYNRCKQSHARRSIAGPGEWPGRRCARIAQERKQTGPRPVGREVESGKSRVRSRVAVAGDVGVNQPRIELCDMVIVELEFLARGMWRVDDEHVRPLGQALDNFCRVRRFEINRYPTLVAIVQVPHVGILGLWLGRNLVPDSP